MQNGNHLLIEEFLQYLATQKRFAANTIISYQTDLENFFTYCDSEYEVHFVQDIQTVMIRSWLAHMKSQKRASKTINRKLSTLKSFFKYLMRKGSVETSPVIGVQSLKVSRKLPVFVEQKDLNRLFEPEIFPDSWEGKLTRLIFEIFYCTGMRLSELILLKESNIDTSSAVIKVWGKGSKERIIPVGNELLKNIANYLSEKRKLFGNESSEFLLVNEKGKKLYPRYVYVQVKKYLSLVSTVEKKSPHILRHSFATHLTNNGAQINAIKELLGHSSLAATQIYTHNSIEKLKEVHRQAHPKS